MSIRIRVDRQRCIGAGTCIHIAPTAFKWVERELLKVDLLAPDTVEEEILREAVAACPTQAIVIEQEEDPSLWAG